MTTDSDGTAAPGCSDPARELLDFYINGSLEGDEEAAVRAHLETCAACAAELGELSRLAAAVAGHGASADAPWSRRRPAMWWASVAAALLVAVGATLYMTRQGPSGRRADPARGPAQVLIDLGTGVLRDSGSPPAAILAPGVETIRLSFFPPVLSDGRYFVSVRCTGGEVLIPEAPLPGLDSMGRAALVLPAAGLVAASCEIVLRVESAEGESRTYTYPFEIERAGPRS
jgi:hypothetical protein